LPGETRLVDLRQTVASRINRERDRATDELRGIGLAAGRAVSEAELDPLDRRASEIAAEVTADSELSMLAAQTRRGIVARARQLRWARTWDRVRARRKLVAGVAAGAVAVAAAFFGAKELLKRPPLLELQVHTSPPGATVTVDRERCAGGDCSFRLRAGAYEVRAELDGYRPAAQRIQLNPPRESLALALQPLPAAAQVRTNFASGRVSIDGRQVGVLKNGQFDSDTLPFGDHRIAVSSADGEVEVSWKAVPGRPPEIAGQPNSHNADAVVVTSLGRSGSIVCDCAGQPVLIDGQPAGTAGPGGLKLTSLAVGTREFRVGDHTFILGIRPEPQMSILLTSSRAVGTLVVETNVPEAAIAVDGKAMGSISARTPFQMPLEAGSHKVDLQSAGYKPAARTVAVDKRNTSRVSILLEPLPKGQLVITGGAAGLTVTVDGAQKGTVDGGSLTVNGIEPGWRKVGLSRAGYISTTLPRRFEAGQTVQLTGRDVDLRPDEKTAAENQRKEDEKRQKEEAENRGKQEKAEWDRVDRNKPEDIDRFLRQYPGGAFADEARKARDAAITRDAEAKKKREADQDEAEWAAVNNKGDRSALQRYLERPGGARHAEDARRQIGQIDDAAQKAAVLRQQEQQRKQLQTAAEDRDRKEQKDKLDVRTALDRYEQAVSDKDETAVKAVYPQVPIKGLRDQFRTYKSIQVSLVSEAAPTIKGDKAEVRCKRVVSYVDRSGRHDVPSESVTVSLSRTATGWVIDRLP
jgi:hypothetical protein